MAEVYLTKPSISLEKEYLEMLKDWSENRDEEELPWFMHLNTKDFSGMVDRLNQLSEGKGLEEGFVENSTYWLITEEKKVLGAINIRHRLNERFLNYGGQIGYGIRPSERNKGYGVKMLHLGLETCKEMGLSKVLICCNEENECFRKTILSNGGVLYSKGVFDGETILKYWFTLDTEENEEN